jgi:microcystin degradation protein MlrC
MKLFVAGLVAETNSFACCPTGFGAFELRLGPHDPTDPMGMASAMQGVASRARAAGWEVAEGVLAAAQPLGPLVDAAYVALKALILRDLEAAMPVSAVVLILHGGMTSQSVDDCEGDLLAAVRSLVGPSVPITASLDLHCHLTALMLQQANALIAYKEYPHTDIVETAERAADLAIAAAEGEIRPRMAAADCRAMGLWPTLTGPLRAFVDRVRALERQPEILSVSVGHGMAYGDVPEAGAKVWVITDDNPAQATRLAQQLALELFGLRERIGTRFAPLPEAMARLDAWRGDKPLVLADVADNPGGGAMGDSTFLLRALADRAIGAVGLGGVWDPGAVQLCREAGEGAKLYLRIGGKCGVTSGDPVDLCVRVRRFVEDHSQDDFGVRADLGPSAWVETDTGLHIVLISKRQQVLGVDLFTGLGLEIAGLHGLVVKSMQHFRTSFAPFIGEVIHVETPGLLRTDFEAIPFQRRDLNYWPRVDDPYAAE